LLVVAGEISSPQQEPRALRRPVCRLRPGLPLSALLPVHSPVRHEWCPRWPRRTGLERMAPERSARQSLHAQQGPAEPLL